MTLQQHKSPLGWKRLYWMHVFKCFVLIRLLKRQWFVLYCTTDPNWSFREGKFDKNLWEKNNLELKSKAPSSHNRNCKLVYCLPQYFPPLFLTSISENQFCISEYLTLNIGLINRFRNRILQNHWCVISSKQSTYVIM